MGMQGGRAGAYCRLSRKQRDGKVWTVEEQEALIRDQIEAAGRTLVGVWVDDGFSAYLNVLRPGYEDMLEHITAGKLDYVYAWVDSRLTRRTLQGEILLGACAENGVILVEDGKEIDPDSDDADMFRMKTMMNQRDSRAKSKMVRQAKAAAARLGNHHGGPRPFGYEADGVTKREAEFVAYVELFDRVVAGDGLARIARDWEDRGIMAPRSGKGFGTRSLRKLVESPRAIGMRMHRGVVVGPGNWPAVVDAATQQRALAAIEGRRSLRSASAPTRQARLLSSLAVCSECEQTMRVGNNHGKLRYLCDRSHGGCCGKVSIVGDAFEAEVETQFLALLTEPETLATLNRLHDERPDVRDYLDTVEACEHELVRLRNLRAADTISLEDYLVLRKAAQQRLDAANAALADAVNVPALLTISPQDTVDRWNEFDLDERRRRLAAFLQGVVVGPSAGRTFDPGRVFPIWRV